MLHLRSAIRKNFLRVLLLGAFSLVPTCAHVLAATADGDFAKRCADPGVVKCVGFDNASDIAGVWGNNSGLTPGPAMPTLDPAVRASGGSALKFTVPSQTADNTSGAYFTNFSSDLSTQFGENSEFFIQWRQRFSPEFISTYYEGNAGIKQAIITTGDQPGKIFASCESTGIVVTSYFQNRFTYMYQSCTGSASHGAYDAFFEPVRGSGTSGEAIDWKLQNARPAPYCLWKNGTFFAPSGNCFGWFPNEWMTFQIHIKTGPRVGDEFVNSYVDLWVAREGQPSELVVRWGPYNLSAAPGEMYGKIWLTPYQTGKNPAQVTPVAYTWYDELIISRTKIADPGSAPVSVNLTAPANNAMLTAPAAVSLSVAAANIAGTVSKVEFYRDATLIGTVASPTSGTVSSGTWSFSDLNVGPGTYRYTAKVFDNAGASTTSAAALVSVTAVTGTGVNVAAQSQGGVASASSVYSGTGMNYSAAGANNGDRKGLKWGQGGGWNDATANAFPDSLQINFNASYSIGHVDIFTAQDNYTAPVEPTSLLTFSQYGITDFQVQYWDGNTWLDVPAGKVSGNNFVWRRIAFQPINTSAIRVVVNSGLAAFARIVEVEAWTTGAGGGGANVAPTVSLGLARTIQAVAAPANLSFTATAADPDGAVTKVELYRNDTLIASAPASISGSYTYTDTNVGAGTYVYVAKAYDNATPTASTTSAPVAVTVNASAAAGAMNVAAQVNGGVATASSAYSAPGTNYLPSGANDGDRKGINWGQGGGWNDGTANAFPDSLQVNFNGTFTINRVDVFTVQDNYTAPVEPTSSLAFTQWGLTSFQVQYYNGATWLDVPGGNVTNNNLVWRTLTFPPLAASAIRVLVNSALNVYSRIVELEAWTADGSANLPPTVTLNAPSNNAMLSAPATVNLSTAAADANGSVSKVEFYRDATLIGTMNSPTSGTLNSGTWAFSDVNVGPGTYRYTAKVYDNAGASATSSPALVSVTAVTATGVNVAAQSRGGVASASSVYSAAGVDYSAAGANNGDRKGLNWGQAGGWNDGTADAFPDWLQINFNGTYAIGHVDIFTAQDNYPALVEPTASMTFTKYGLTDFQVQYWNGSAWLDVPNGKVANNNFVWRRIAFAPINTNAIRVAVNSALQVFSRVIELEAWSLTASTVGSLPLPPADPTDSKSSPAPSPDTVPAASGARNPAFDVLPSGTAMHLGGYTCTDVVGEWSGKCKLVTDYSGMVFDKKRREFLVFGGGHSSTNYDGVNGFSMNTLAWKERYKPTGCPAMLSPGNFDGANGTWRSAASGPTPRPVARHTVDLMAIADDRDELVMMTYIEGNGSCDGWSGYNGFNFVAPGKIGHFNLATNEWTFSDAPNEMQWPGAEYDPVSKKIIMLGLDGLMVYDPATKTKALAIDVTRRYIPDEQGSLFSHGILRYNNNLVYFPPNQKMYYFDRFDKRVIEITLDRSNFGNSQIVVLNTSGTPSPHGEPGYAYDSVNKIIGGAVHNNKFYAFDPLTKSWTAKDVLGGAPGNQAFHAIGYDDVNNVFLFITEDRQTWAYRYKK
jgi:hypothetical protein